MQKDLRQSIFFLISIGFVSYSSMVGCSYSNKNRNEQTPTDVKQELMEANSILTDTENQEIEDYIERNGWEMLKTGSGLRYMIIETQNGEPAKTDDIAVFHYSTYLITGDMIYSSEGTEPAQFRIGQGGVESGLEEGFLLLKKGDRARLILPAHLAHGVPGDGLKVPSRATLIYDIELIDLN